MYRQASFLVLAVAAAVLIKAPSASTWSRDAPVSIYNDRALKLPSLEKNDLCPVSIGDRDVVSSDHPYIAGAGGYFYGSGPVYLALGWKPPDRAEAYFDLDPRTQSPDGYRLKTPWIMNPEYQGQALVRGAKIGSGASGQILFTEATQSQRLAAKMILRSGVPGTVVPGSQIRAVDAGWGFWPSYVILQGPGCYALQIDTERGSDIVVFEAKPKK